MSKPTKQDNEIEYWWCDNCDHYSEVAWKLCGYCKTPRPGITESKEPDYIVNSPVYPTQDNDKEKDAQEFTRLAGALRKQGLVAAANFSEQAANALGEAISNNNGSGNDEDTMPIIETLIKVKEGYNYLDANRDLEALIADRLVEARLEELDALNSIKRCGCMVCDALADRISEIKGGKE